ncbi:MAG: MarR family winged helix-turn-helix transcriptional regulator [Candidatus Dormibacteria bacterium]
MPNVTSLKRRSPGASAQLAGELRPVLTAITMAWRREMAGSVSVSVSQAQILLCLDAQPARISELARANGIAGPSATVMVERMEAVGLVSRRRDPRDGRSVLVELTGAGREALTSVSAIRTRLLAARLGSLSPEDLASLTAALPALMHLQEAWAAPNSTAAHRRS